VSADAGRSRWQISTVREPPTVIKWRSDLDVPDPGRPYKLTVGLMFNHLAANGMPDLGAEGALLHGVEQDLEAVLAEHAAVLALSVTGRGNREWVAYAPSHKWVAAWAAGFADRWLGEHTHQISVAKDADWTTYLAFAGMPPGDTQG
jgi:hypothetical protein